MPKVRGLDLGMRSRICLGALLLLWASLGRGEPQGGAVAAAGAAGAAGVMIIGDSHLVGSFGDALHQGLADLKRFPVMSVAVCAARVTTFIGAGSKTHCGYRIRQSSPPQTRVRTTLMEVKSAVTQPLSAYFSEGPPRILIAQLGMNYGAHSPAGIAAEVVKLGQFAREHGIGKVLLVGPPAYYKSAYVNEAFARGVAADPEHMVFVAASGFNAAAPLKRGGLHFGPRQAQEWGRHVLELIMPEVAAAFAVR